MTYMRIATMATMAAAAGLAVGTAAAQDDPVERGRYLVEGPAGCGNCHSPLGPEGFIEGAAYSGRLVEETAMFTAYAPNITPAGDVGTWSDAELARAIREGIRPDGSVIGPPMPQILYRGLGDEDLAAIVAYLRTLTPVESDVPESVYTFPLPPAWGPPVQTVTAPDRGVSVEYGAYLAGPVAHCVECHTTFGPMGPMFDTHLGAGGYEFHGPWGVSIAPNITSHGDGIADYTDAELARMITAGTRPNGDAMLPPMPYWAYANMTQDDLEAVILYLRSLPPLPDPH